MEKDYFQMTDEELREHGVENMEAWYKYREFAQNPIINEERHQKASDGTIVDLGWLTHWLKKKVAHLPKDEQDKFIELRKQYQSCKSSETIYYRNAFGDNVGNAKSLNKGGKKDKYNFLSVKKIDLIELFGKYYNITEVLEIATVEWGIKISKEVLASFRRDHIEQIKEKQELFKASFSDIRLGIKRSRLEELSWLYKHHKSKLLSGKGSTPEARLMKEILKDIKSEVEGDRLLIQGSIDVNVDLALENHARNEILKSLPIKQIIIAKVAAKNGVSVKNIVHKLTRSTYAGIAGVLEDEIEDIEYKDVESPTNQHYDFNKIEAQAEAGELEIQRLEEAEKVKEKQASKIASKTNKKSRLKELLRRKTTLLSENRLNVEKYQGRKNDKPRE